MKKKTISKRPVKKSSKEKYFLFDGDNGEFTIFNSKEEVVDELEVWFEEGADTDVVGEHFSNGISRIIKGKELKINITETQRKISIKE